MYPKWIQRYIAGYMDTRSHTIKPVRLSQLGDKVTRNHPTRKKMGVIT